MHLFVKYLLQVLLLLLLLLLCQVFFIIIYQVFFNRVAYFMLIQILII